MFRKNSSVLTKRSCGGSGRVAFLEVSGETGHLYMPGYAEA